MLTDTHAHLYYPQLHDSIQEILDNARSENVTSVIVPAVDLKTSLQVFELSQKYSEIYCAIGIHPCDVSKAKTGDLEQIAELLHNEKVLAVGETGLDYYWDSSNAEQQKELFRKQIKLAQALSLPVVIHTRYSLDDAMEIVREESINSPVRTHFHCFSGNVSQMEECLSIDGSVISFCGNITYKNSQLDEVVRLTPLDRMLSETDSPFLAPMPYRGKRNEPAFMTKTIMKISELKSLEFEDAAAKLARNAREFYKF